MPDRSTTLKTARKPVAVAPPASIREVLGGFQSLRAEILNALGSVAVDPTRTRELARALDLNRGLAWRITRIARSADGSDVAHDVPGPASIRKFVDSCVALGASEDTAQRVIDASQRFEDHVQTCSGDRKTLGMLLANKGDTTSSQDRERARRTLFEGACSVWGVQAQTRFVTVFLFPSRTNPGTLDAAHVTGYLGFRRLSARPWPMSYEAFHNNDGAAQILKKHPLDPTGHKEGELQLLRDFCSPRDPDIAVSHQGSYKVFELAAGPVGNVGLTTCVFGSYLDDIYERTAGVNNTAGFMVLLQTPVEYVHFDYFIHKDVKHEGPIVTHLLDRLTYPHENRVEDFDDQSMPIQEQAVDLQPGLNAAATTRIPQYPQLLRFIQDRIEIPNEDFRCSRFEMAYPPISTTLSRRITLPDA